MITVTDLLALQFVEQRVVARSASLEVLGPQRTEQCPKSQIHLEASTRRLVALAAPGAIFGLFDHRALLTHGCVAARREENGPAHDALAHLTPVELLQLSQATRPVCLHLLGVITTRRPRHVAVILTLLTQQTNR